MPATKILYESKNGTFDISRHSKGIGKGIFYQFSIAQDDDAEPYTVNFVNVSISQMQHIADAIDEELQFARTDKPTKPIKLFVEKRGKL